MPPGRGEGLKGSSTGWRESDKGSSERVAFKNFPVRRIKFDRTSSQDMIKAEIQSVILAFRKIQSRRGVVRCAGLRLD